MLMELRAVRFVVLPSARKNFLELQACDLASLVVVVDHNVPLNGTVEPGKASKQVGKGRKRPVVPARLYSTHWRAHCLPERTRG